MARLLGKSPSNLAYWVDKLSCPKKSDGSYSAPEVVAWIMRREYSKGLSDGAKLASEGEDPSNVWDNRKKKAQALMAELQLSDKQKEYLKHDEVKTSWLRVLSMLRSTLQAIPKTMAATLAGMSREDAFEALDKSIRDAVDHFIDAYEQEEKKWDSKK